MISLIWPYWDRQSVADMALRRLVALYTELDMEIVVVDDGSPRPYQVPVETPWPVRVLRLPAKTQALNPCVPINVAVREAAGSVIALSGPDVWHRSPVLQRMRRQLDQPSAHGVYVTAACWFAPGNCWHAHSSARPTVEGIEMPEGAHYHWLAMLSRDLWDAAGGFDEEYRNGAAYDDPDWLLRLQRAGAEFIMRDDLVVDHIRSEARARWPAGANERNRLLFRSKWCGG